MSARESQLKGRLRLTHLLEVTEAVDERLTEQRPRFQRLAREDSAPRVVSAFNLFQTPESLATRVVSLLSDGRSLGRTLEPSAGLGRLYRAVRAVDTDCPVTLVDNSPECCRELYIATETDQNVTLFQADFLSCDRLGMFDSIVMNPPFKMGTDCKHILRALTLLNPGGRLVSLCAAGPRQREKLGRIASEWIDLPSGSFREAGTNVESAIVIFNR